MAKAEFKTERLEARIPTSVKAELVRAAKLQGMTLSDFILSVATPKARQVIREHELIELTRTDQIAFAQSLLKPAKANKKLKQAAYQYQNENKG